MRAFDRRLQLWRLRQAARFVSGRVRVIDVGAFHGELFQLLGDRLIEGFGVEPLLTHRLKAGPYTIEPGFFPAVRPPGCGWDVITMLAVLEHIPESQHVDVADACYQLLRDGGRLIVTVPAPTVDRLLAVLKFLGVVDGMSLDEHHGYLPEQTPSVFGPPRFRLCVHKRFQMGLNHVFVFEKEPAAE